MHRSRIESPAGLPTQKYLFYEKDLHGILRHYKEQARVLVNRLPENDFIDATDEQLLGQISESLTVTPIVVEEKPEFERDYASPVKKFHLGFRGDAWIFNCRPKDFCREYPVAKVDSSKDKIIIRVDLPSNSSSGDIKKLLDTELGLVHDYVRLSTEQVAKYHHELPNVVGHAIAQRRAVIAHYDQIAAELEIPILPRADAPSLTPEKVELRKHPRLASTRADASSEQRYITEETFESVLHCIRHMGRTFETAPGVFSLHDEEGLRTILLAMLNGHFEGAAKAEAFRKRGKTDILIEEKNRSAFVGECKVWTGQSGAAAAIDQLLGLYVTWRDSKAALIIFNKGTKNFSTIREKLPSVVKSHPLFAQDIGCNELGEWRMQMQRVKDETDLVTLHVFAFNICADTLA